MIVYEQQTKQSILERMLDATRSDIDKRQGSITYDLLSPAAIELAHCYIQLDQVLRFGFAGPDQPSHFLDLRTSELGVTRRPSVKAVGKLRFQGDDGTIIPSRTMVSTAEETPVYFLTTEAGTITGGYVEVSAEAKEGGKHGNVAANRITLLTGNLTGIVKVTNDSGFVNGADIESDESLLERYYDRVRRPATSGNIWHYRQWALEIPGVGDVKVFPVWKGNGTVKLSLLSDDKRAPSDTIVCQVYQYIKELRPIGADVTVQAAQETLINVSAQLTLQSGADLTAINSLFEAELSAYLADLAFKESVVRYNRIFGLLLDIDAVIDFSDLKLNGVTGNILLPEDHVAVAGTVNFIVT